MIRNIYVLWDIVFVICMGSMYRYFVEYRYFVRYESCWSYMRSTYGYFVRNMFVKYMEVWEIFMLNIVNTWAYNCY